jgi:hypothetical protein
MERFAIKTSPSLAAQRKAILKNASRSRRDARKALRIGDADTAQRLFQAALKTSLTIPPEAQRAAAIAYRQGRIGALKGTWIAAGRKLGIPLGNARQEALTKNRGTFSGALQSLRDSVAFVNIYNESQAIVRIADETDLVKKAFRALIDKDIRPYLRRKIRELTTLKK